MVIKLADIGGPAKKRRLHVTWTKAICQEFFEQVTSSTALWHSALFARTSLLIFASS